MPAPRTNHLKPVEIGVTYWTVYGDRATVVALDTPCGTPGHVLADVPNPFSDTGLVSRVPIRSDNLVGPVSS